MIEFMTQPVFELSNFSRITLALKGAAQAFQPPIAFSLPVLCLFGDELFHQWLKLRQPLAFATVNRSKSNRDQSRYLAKRWERAAKGGVRGGVR